MIIYGDGDRRVEGLAGIGCGGDECGCGCEASVEPSPMPTLCWLIGGAVLAVLFAGPGRGRK